MCLLEDPLAGNPLKQYQSNISNWLIFNRAEKHSFYLCRAPYKIMTRIALIPARYAATRFPGKLMQLLGNIPVIRRTYMNTVATGLFDDVIVVTDSPLILKKLRNTAERPS